MFGGIFFGQYWPEGAAVAGDEGLHGGDYVEGGAKKKKKKPEDVQWPQPWMHERPAKKPLSPPAVVAEPVLAPAPPVVAKPMAVVVPAELAGALGREIKIIDPSIAEKARFLQMRLRRELDEEELLTLMGFFD